MAVSTGPRMIWSTPLTCFHTSQDARYSMASIRCLSMLIAPRGVVPRPVLGPQKEPRAGFGRGDGGGVGSAVGSGLGLWLGADVSGVGTGEGRGEGMDVGRVVGARVGGGEDVFDGAGVGGRERRVARPRRRR